MRDLLGGVLIGGVFGLALGRLALWALVPPLAGYDCEGASGTLYAYEEDEFPRCKKIVRL